MKKFKVAFHAAIKGEIIITAENAKQALEKVKSIGLYDEFKNRLELPFGSATIVVSSVQTTSTAEPAISKIKIGNGDASVTVEEE